MTKHIAIIGAGYSGTLQAIQLLALTDARVTLIERAQPARGVAYSTSSADHLLNVRASGMSAYPDRPAHFADWLASEGLGGPTTFAQRRIYGAYLEAQLAEARALYGERLTIVADEAVDVVAGPEGEGVTLASGNSLIADLVILCIGNLAPDVPGIIARTTLPDDVYVADPWAGPILDDLSDDDTVLLIGTGLTAVDAALMLDAGGFRGRTLALSRRGLLPRAHKAPIPPPGALHLESRCTALLRAVRGIAKESGWRAAVDSLRPHTQRLWAEASLAERRRFLRHLRPWWDVHRHRIAPEIADRLEQMMEEGRLDIAAGRITAIATTAVGALVEWRPRGADQVNRLTVRRIVNCTGPQSDIARADNPLIRSLVEAGRIRPDACRIGIDVDDACRTVDRNGSANVNLLAVGPLTKGALWEIVAVPDLRLQTKATAERIGNG
ncbi:FAD/NAD(P)-binding protein [Allosphingosinicella vermicomposti]|uniref:FAD/NAD(P)-binding protein n=1 Tax=Allosphingosinicella vermicomposti TaxID=614671 RepID=UPI000D0FDD64|nr:FAD/NAD(P)-binding protein [Allosphingosinicella vermicomposti]